MPYEKRGARSRYLSTDTEWRVACVKFSKREITYELGKGLGLFTNAGARLRQPELRRERARALTPSQSNRFVHKPPQSL